MKLQLITRDAVPDRKSDYSNPNWQEDARRPVPKSALCFLFLEAPVGTYADETFHMTRHSEMRGRMRFEIEKHVVPMNDRWTDETPYPYDHVDNCLTNMTVVSEGFDNLLGIGKVLLRRTPMPVADGMEGFVGAGILLRTTHVPESTLVSFETDFGRLRETSRDVVENAFPMGGVPRQILERPIWGFGAEKRSFGGTLPMAVAQTLDRWNDLKADRDRTPAEDAELEALSESQAVRDFYGHTRRVDGDYAAFLDHFQGPDAYAARTKLMDCPTAEERDVADQGFQETFEAWFRAREDEPRRRLSP